MVLTIAIKIAIISLAFMLVSGNIVSGKPENKKKEGPWAVICGLSAIILCISFIVGVLAY